MQYQLSLAAGETSLLKVTDSYKIDTFVTQNLIEFFGTSAYTVYLEKTPSSMSFFSIYHSPVIETLN